VKAKAREREVRGQRERYERGRRRNSGTTLAELAAPAAPRTSWKNAGPVALSTAGRSVVCDFRVTKQHAGGS
jgi:hypothetical protein